MPFGCWRSYVCLLPKWRVLRRGTLDEAVATRATDLTGLQGAVHVHQSRPRRAVRCAAPDESNPRIPLSRPGSASVLRISLLIACALAAPAAAQGVTIAHGAVERGNPLVTGRDSLY
jgi:hypothetical protein